jgi:hypothetical protein
MCRQSETEIDGELGTIMNCSLFYEDMDIITFIKVDRLKWAGHAVRMDQQRPAKVILNAKPEGRRKRKA